MDHQHHSATAQTLGSFFSSSGFMPHGHCYLWKTPLVWLHFSTDLLIGLAYVSISISLYLLVRRIRLPFSAVFVSFGAFIGFCGLTHFMEVYTLWYPEYWWSGLVKAVTAAASVATAGTMYPLKPKVIAIAEAARLSESRRVELEEAYGKLQRADELKTHFFANVSHELRTPLTLILGPVTGMLESKEPLTLTQRKSLETVERSARLLLKQVSDLLDISKLEAGRLKPVFSRIDLSRLLGAMAGQFESAMASKGIRFVVELAPSLAAELDLEKTQRIVMNLLSNALKFTPRDGVVRLSVTEKDGLAIIEVADSGPGVPPEQRELVFERFEQGDSSATRRVGGTGLGLAIVREFVLLQGGEVLLESAPEGGALFIVQLPLTAPQGSVVEQGQIGAVDDPAALDSFGGVLAELEPVTTASMSDAGRPSGVRPTILLCDDNASMRELVIEVLEPEFQVVPAADGRQGFELAEKLRPDLIISDIMMPELSGDKLLVAVRQSPAIAQTPVLLLSAKADDGLRVRLLREGAQDYVTKPFERQELMARVRNLVAIKRTRDLLCGELKDRSSDIEQLARVASDRKRELELALERAERASEVKTHFLSLVSHELRTPLTTVSLNLQSALRLPEASRVPEISRNLNRALNSSRQLADLIDSLLEYTRLESGKASIDPAEIDLAALAQELLEEYSAQARARGLELRSSIPPELRLRSDGRLLRVVLSNLMSNAIKFTENGFVELHMRRDGHRIVLEVRDTGPGIRPEDKERVFEPFAQLGPIVHKRVSGVGLGLALVRQMVDSLLGHVEVDSKVGEGSVFRVVLADLN